MNIINKNSTPRMDLKSIIDHFGALIILKSNEILVKSMVKSTKKSLKILKSIHNILELVTPQVVVLIPVLTWVHIFLSPAFILINAV